MATAHSAAPLPMAVSCRRSARASSADGCPRHTPPSQGGCFQAAVAGASGAAGQAVEGRWDAVQCQTAGRTPRGRPSAKKTFLQALRPLGPSPGAPSAIADPPAPLLSLSHAAMALLRSLRQAVLATVRVPANPLAQQAAAPASLQFWRGFGDASYLDKKDVTDRVLGVVKNFEKVEEGKVRCASLPGTLRSFLAGRGRTGAPGGLGSPPRHAGRAAGRAAALAVWAMCMRAMCMQLAGSSVLVCTGVAGSASVRLPCC